MLKIVANGCSTARSTFQAQVTLTFQNLLGWRATYDPQHRTTPPQTTQNGDTVTLTWTLAMAGNGGTPLTPITTFGGDFHLGLNPSFPPDTDPPQTPTPTWTSPSQCT